MAVRINPAVRPTVYVGRSGRLDCSFDVAPRNTATRRSPSQSSTSWSPDICSARRLAACSSMQSSFAAQITCRLLSTTNTLYRMMQSHPKGGPSPYSNVRVRPRQTSMNARGTFVRVAIRLYQRARPHRPREDTSVTVVRGVRFSGAISPRAKASGSSLRWRASPASSVVRQAKLSSGLAPRCEPLQ